MDVVELKPRKWILNGKMEKFPMEITCSRAKKNNIDEIMRMHFSACVYLR